MFKPGDEVFIRAEVTDISPSSERPYFVAPDKYSVNWVSEDKIIPMDKTYSDGLSDAWELAFKIAKMNMTEITKIFGCGYSAISSLFTAEEAFAKIESYEKEKEIKVGDVVLDDTDLNSYAIVTRVDGDVLYTMCSDGSCGREMYPEYFKKTGKHIDIESLLRQIGE